MPKFDEAALVAAVIAGRSLNQIAAASGASVSTVQRRLKDPGIIAQVNEGRCRQRDQLVGQLANLRTRAIDKLGALIDDDAPAIALKAASTVLATSARFDLIHELGQRIAALEQPPEDAADSPLDSDDNSGHRQDRRDA